MNDAINNWLAELSAVPNMIEPAERIGGVLRSLYLEGNDNPHAVELFDGIVWITSHREKSAVERLAMIDKLLSLETPAIVDMKEFSKW
jgi:hypothetical protein